MSPIIRAQRNHPKRHDDTEQKDTPQPDPALRSARCLLYFCRSFAPLFSSHHLLVFGLPTAFSTFTAGVIRLTGRSRVPVTCMGRMHLYLFFMLLSLCTRALISRPPVLSPILLLHFAPSIFLPYVGRCYKN